MALAKLAIKELAKRELKKRGLDMSQAGRMGRAEAGGFDAGRPLYIGTKTDIPALKTTGLKRPTSGGQSNKGRISATADPEVASRYAETIAYGNGLPKNPSQWEAQEYFAGLGMPDVADHINRYGWREAVHRPHDPAGGNVMKVLTSADLKTVDASDFHPSGPNGFKMFTQAENAAKAEGYGGVRYENVPDYFPDDKDKVALFDPTQVRSVNAAFDPEKADSSNLLAGLQGAAPIAGAALAAGALAPQDAQADDGYARYAMPSGRRLDGPQVQGPPTEPLPRSFIDHSIGELDLLGSVASGLGHSMLGGLSGLGGLLMGNSLDEAVEDIRSFEDMNSYELGEEGRKTLESLVTQYGESHPFVKKFITEYMKSGDYWGDKAFEATQKVAPSVAPAVGTGVKMGFELLQ